MSTISTVNNRVLFSDTEGAVHTDFNDIQQFMRSFLADGLIGCKAAAAYGDAFPSLSYLWTPNPMQGYAKPGASALQTTNAAGWVGQWSTSGVGDGMSPRFLFYRLAADDLLTTHDAGAVNNRWDGIFVKITEVETDAQDRDFEDNATRINTSDSVSKKVRTQLDVSVVKGATAANPVYPSTPAGYVPFAYVYIATAEAGVLDYDKVGDARMPMRFGSQTVYAAQMAVGTDANNYTLHSTRLFLEQGVGAIQDAYAFFPGDMAARILRVTVEGQFTADPVTITGQVRRYDLRTLSIASPGPKAITQFSIADGVTAQTVIAPPISTGNAGPVWGCGKPAGPGYIVSVGGQAIQLRTVVDIATDGSPSLNRPTMVRFDYAY